LEDGQSADGILPEFARAAVEAIEEMMKNQ
jgi:hypothetical protein